MRKELGNKAADIFMSYIKDLIVTDPSKLPGKWWNYLVNPIVGYYIPKATLYKKQKV